MYIAIKNLYDIEDEHKAWYRKLGLCFDFVNDKKYATDLTEEEINGVLQYKEFYLNQYKASEMLVEA